MAGTERGLLLTCLWYIRAVDPQTLLLTGLTRDGVYLVENGEITGAVNNFRFNESPVDLLRRFSHASATVPAFSREWGDDYFSRTAMPALRVPDFNMSSVSQAAGVRRSATHDPEARRLPDRVVAVVGEQAGDVLPGSQGPRRSRSPGSRPGRRSPSPRRPVRVYR